MFGIGPWELMLVFAIVLLLFGGKRLPGIATGLGSAIKNFKSAMRDPGPEQIEGPKT
ncbi:MAG: twin-arginine translocase TatA/TatE family subunit [Myxococcaceae bacterium]